MKKDVKYWWNKFVKTAKKLLPLMYFWIFVYVIVMYILWATKSSECPDNSSLGYIAWSVVWWGIYWWILCWTTITSKRFHLPDPNWEKAYNTMRSKYIHLKKRTAVLSFASEARALQVKDYVAFIEKLKREGRITEEELKGKISQTKKEYRRRVLENKPKKGTK